VFNLNTTPNPDPKPLKPVPHIQAVMCLDSATGCGIYAAKQLIENNFGIGGEPTGRSLGQLIAEWNAASGMKRMQQ
jgi:hypothetical protein